MKKKRFRSATHVTIALALSFSLLWLACMGLMTWTTAVLEIDRLTKGMEYARDNMEDALQGFFDSGSMSDSGGNESVKNTDPENSAFWTEESCRDEAFLNTIRACTDTSFRLSYDLPEISLLSDEDSDVDRAVLIYGPDNKLCFKSGSYLYFHYVKDNETSDDEEQKSSFGYINIDSLEGEGAEHLLQSYRIRDIGSYYGDTLRIKGAVKGDEIIPYSIERLADGDDADDPDNWTIEYETTEKNSDALVLYVDTTFELDSTISTETPANYKSPDGEVWTDFTSYVQSNEENGEGIISDDINVKTLSNYTRREYIWITDAADEDTEADRYYDICYAFSANPLQIAFNELKYIYLITAVFTILIFWILRSLFNRKMLQPQEKLLKAIEEGTLLEESKGKVWKEAENLKEYYVTTYEHREDDVKEILRLYKALLYAQEAEQNRRQLTNGIAHELKTPLAIIHSYAEGLQSHIAEEKRDRYLETILTESEKLDDMIMEMLDLSRLEAGRIKLTLDAISLSGLARETLSRYDRMIEDKQIKLTTAIPDTHPVMADETRIIQVMDNFLSNAVCYTPEGGKIHVSCEEIRKQVRFTVENTGTPFTLEELRKVWDTFYKTDSARSGKGTGLGLAIARNVVELHGGNVFVNNTKDGVKFGFYLKI